MGKQATEMLKGTLEGIVLGILSGRSAYGYEITGWLRIEQRGYVDVTKEPSEKGPPRKVYTLNEAGRLTLQEFWSNWSFLAERIDQLRTPVDVLGAETARKENPRIEGEPS
jgi:PadR family transcriptional regulator PadR